MSAHLHAPLKMSIRLTKIMSALKEGFQKYSEIVYWLSGISYMGISGKIGINSYSYLSLKLFLSKIWFFNLYIIMWNYKKRLQEKKYTMLFNFNIGSMRYTWIIYFAKSEQKGNVSYQFPISQQYHILCPLVRCLHISFDTLC